jgi:stage V sporulation protein B
MYMGSDFIAQELLKDARTALSLRILAPGMPFLAVSACLRGYFIANRNMGNPAAGQVLEQLVKMVFVAVLLSYWLPRGVEYGCAAVVFGITFGELVCFAFTLLGFVPERGRLPRTINTSGATGRILGIIVPVSLSAYARSGLRLIEDVLVLSGLKAYMPTGDLATETYGRVKGMVMPLLVFPLSLLSAFVVTLTPEISRLGAKNAHERLERVVSRILQVTCIVGIFIVAIFMTFSYELGLLFYRDPDVGETLRQMAFICPFMCIEMVVVGILQGLGQQNAVMRYSVADCLLRVAMVYALVPATGVRGFLWTVIASNVFTSALNLRKLLKTTKIRLRVNDWLLKPALAAASASQIVKTCCNLWFFSAFSVWQVLAVGLAAIAAVYLAVLFSVGSVAPEDFKWIISRLRFEPKRLSPQPDIAAI